jgi:serine/threonine protein phosphatase 1
VSKLCIVGDVHGEISLLIRLIHNVPSEVKLVFVGDLVNQGPDSRSVLELVGNLVQDGRAIAVMGNHERALLRFLDDGAFVPFAHHGGMATIRSYVGIVNADVHRHFIESFPHNHMELIQGFLPFFETNDLIVTHAGIDPSRPLARDLDSLTIGDPAERLRPTAYQKHLVFGHFPQRQITRRGRSICVDTGCGYGGSLSCLFWPEGDVLSVSKIQA